VRTQISTSVSEETRRQAAAIMARTGYGLRELLTLAIDRMYREDQMHHLSYEADAETIDEAVLARARAIHAEVCGCDDKRCPITDEIYQWLVAGDRGQGRTTADLVAEWTEYTSAE
jgi:hypothetical protein